MYRLFAVLCLQATPTAAQDRAGDFDYYVMSLSWSANWCALDGDSRNSPQCDPEADFGWILHGLWLQYERGFSAQL
ncbi:MAG: ribonuclease T2 [Yoonia sp.]|jgi:ribonuclease T2